MVYTFSKMFDIQQTDMCTNNSITEWTSSIEQRFHDGYTKCVFRVMCQRNKSRSECYLHATKECATNLQRKIHKIFRKLFVLSKRQVE